MPSRLEDDWSDSEDENLSEIETSVLLGIPDGEIDKSEDVLDPAVSRIGGLPVFLPSRPLPSSSSHCKLCSRPMPLLVQMWCPFEGSAMDRALYVWGCERPECQRKAGSLRAWRGLKFNHKYAAKLEKRKAREAEKASRQVAEAAARAEEKQRQTVNPFSGAGKAQLTFGLGTQLFGGSEPFVTAKEKEDSASESESESEDSTSEDGVDSVAEKLQSISLQPPEVPIEWSTSPSYNPVYLSTISEYIPPPPKSKKPSQEYPDEDIEDRKAGKDWGLEGWENSTDVDPVFDRFVRRISSESEQCVRYDLKGTPLPFGSRDAMYDRLFPPPPPAPFTTKPGFAAPIAQRRTFSPNTIDKCDSCGAGRVFECQLMPNLINVLRGQAKHSNAGSGNKERTEESSQSEEERKVELERVLKAGMEWGTCFIFSCVEDCYTEDEGWREELVLVQWDE